MKLTPEGQQDAERLMPLMVLVLTTIGPRNKRRSMERWALHIETWNALMRYDRMEDKSVPIQRAFDRIWDAIDMLVEIGMLTESPAANARQSEMMRA